MDTFTLAHLATTTSYERSVFLCMSVNRRSINGDKLEETPQRGECEHHWEDELKHGKMIRNLWARTSCGRLLVRPVPQRSQNLGSRDSLWC